MEGMEWSLDTRNGRRCVPRQRLTGAGLATLVRRMVPILVGDGRPGKPAMASPTVAHAYPLTDRTRDGESTRLGLELAARPVAAAAGAGLRPRRSSITGSSPRRSHCAPDAAALAELLATADVAGPGTPSSCRDRAGAVRRSRGCSSALAGARCQNRVVHLKRPGRPLWAGRCAASATTATPDFAVHERHAARMTTDPRFSPVGRIVSCALHRNLYPERHPARLNPAVHARVLPAAGRVRRVRVRGWSGDDGDLVAFNVRLVRDGVIWWTIGGYDAAAALASACTG